MIDSAPENGVRNSQPAGIGRIATLRGGCAWNNLGRNVVFADRWLRPAAVFADTEFPDDDEKSQFDLDIHAIVDLAGPGRVAVLNHLGTLRIFEPWTPAPAGSEVPLLFPQGRLEFLADLERTATLGDRLVTSRPRSERCDGVLVTAPLTTARERAEADSAQESFGFVTALASCSTADGTGWIALGGENRVRLVGADRGRLGPVRWEVDLEFLPTVLVDAGATLWVAGSAPGGTDIDDYDWERLHGGGLAQLDSDSGEVLGAAVFGGDLAWGSGGVPFVLAGGVPCGVGRRGQLHRLGPGATVTVQVTDQLASRSLGIAHAVVVGDRIVFGFNRGGYRLHAASTGAVTAPRPGQSSDRS